MRLEDEAYLVETQAPQVASQPPSIEHLFPVEAHSPGIRLDDTSDYIQQRAFPGAARPTQPNDGARVDVQRYVAQGVYPRHTFAEML